MPAKTILVIDDDAVDRKAIIRALKTIGSRCEVHEAEDGRTGLACALAHSFDCILVDYHLPGQSGLEVLSELRTHPEIDAPMIMLTGEGSELIAVEAMKRGAQDYLPKALMAPDSLYRVIANAVEKHSLQHQLAEAQRLLERQALYDTQTGLGNRNLFNRELVRALAGAARREEKLCVFVMDLNKFKVVNDTFGHEAGDAVLAEVGRRFLEVARTEDAYFRLGGDEFAAILDLGGADDAGKVIGRRLIAAMAQPIAYRDQLLEVGISIGMAIFPADGDDPEALVRTADHAMYAAKTGGSGFASSFDRPGEGSCA